MSRYRCVGSVPSKRHTVHRDRDGTRLVEELIGEDGFSGASSLLYHRGSPSAVTAIEPVEGVVDEELRPNLPVQPRHLRTGRIAFDDNDDPWTSRRTLAGNDDVSLAVAGGATPSPLLRNALGDEVTFVHRGGATLESSFGPLPVREGDYVVVPAGITHRWVPHETMSLFVISAAGHVRFPERYLSSAGQFLEHAPFCERDVRGPEAVDPVVGGDVDVLVRTRHGLSRHRHVHHPFDVVGWDGCCYPFALSISDFEPIVGSLHQPPPVHQTFAGPGFVLCSFVPRPFDFHPDAVKIPYHHSNVDSDEVLFYVAGDFMSRAGAGIEVGSMTVHPAGFVHGPQPGSYERSVDATRTDETAVMIDTFRPLLLTGTADAVADTDYWRTWAGEGREG